MPTKRPYVPRTADRSVGQTHSYNNNGVKTTVAVAPLNGMRDRIRREEEEDLRFAFRDFGEAVKTHCLEFARVRLNGGTRDESRRAGGPRYADSFSVQFLEPYARKTSTEWKIIVSNDAEVAHILEDGHKAEYPIPSGLAVGSPLAKGSWLAYPKDNVNFGSGVVVRKRVVMWRDDKAGEEFSASGGYHIMRDAVDLAREDAKLFYSNRGAKKRGGGSNRSRVGRAVDRNFRI